MDFYNELPDDIMNEMWNYVESVNRGEDPDDADRRLAKVVSFRADEETNDENNG